MFFNKAWEGETGQDITAVNDKSLIPDTIFDVFDASPGFQQSCFMHQLKRDPIIIVVWKMRGKLFRQMVRVDPEFLDAGLAQVIEGKCDQRLPKNWKQRFRQEVRPRPQPNS